MSDPSGGTAAATDTPEEILEATYRALCEHGYAELTMQDIADESEKSKAALHYHFDTKDELMLAFLDHLYASVTAEYGDPSGDNAVERLFRFVDGILCRSDVERDEQFQTALLEIKAQAPYDEAYRTELERVDAFVRREVREIVAEGVEEGVFRADADPEDTAAFIATLISGVNTRRVSIGETDGGTRRTFVSFVREHLVAPDADVDVDAVAEASVESSRVDDPSADTDRDEPSDDDRGESADDPDPEVDA